MTLDYPNALNSSNDDSENDTTFHNNSEDSNKSKEIIPPSLKCMRKNSMKKIQEMKVPSLKHAEIM